MLFQTNSSTSVTRMSFRLLSALGVAAVLTCVAVGQKAKENAVPPSNPQLVSPAIEKRVDDLLKKMTLEEKIGQLVQYNDVGYTEPGNAARLAANPEGAQSGEWQWSWPPQGQSPGSMLNTIGAGAHESAFSASGSRKRAACIFHCFVWRGCHSWFSRSHDPIRDPWVLLQHSIPMRDISLLSYVRGRSDDCRRALVLFADGRHLARCASTWGTPHGEGAGRRSLISDRPCARRAATYAAINRTICQKTRQCSGFCEALRSLRRRGKRAANTTRQTCRRRIRLRQSLSASL